MEIKYLFSLWCCNLVIAPNKYRITNIRTFDLRTFERWISFVIRLFGCSNVRCCFSRNHDYFQYRTILILMLGLFYSCTPKPIDININKFKPKLVVSSHIIPGSIMIMSLTKSFSALSSTEATDTSVSSNFLQGVLVSNAEVTVTHGNKIDTLRMLTPGIYGSVSLLQEDYGFYILKARDPLSGMEVIASSTLLPKVFFDTITPVKSAVMLDTTVSIKYTLLDNPNEDNWYVVNYIKKNLNTSGANLDINNAFSLGSNKILTEFELLSDKTFENHRFEQETILTDVNPSDSIAVTIANISEGYYQFLTAYKRAGSVFNQFTGEPINYPTNVTGGYGYFNTHYPDVHYFYLKNY